MFSSRLKTFYSHFLLVHLNKKPASNKGFTLIELLVTALIAGGIISGLLYLTNELLTSDTRESNRTETQRELQLALDFMAAEVKQAMHIYTPTEWALISDKVTLPSHPNEPKATIPVLAFWKQQPLDESIKVACATSPASVIERVTCFSGHSYSFVVYAFSENTTDNLWQGKGGILRYEMSEDGLASSSNYISPVDQRLVRFVSNNDDPDNPTIGWPFDQEVTLLSPEILIDFIDFVDSDKAYTPPCDAGYEASPAAAPQGGFYACINPDTAATAIGFGNQDVVLYLHGNAKGRSGLMTDTSFLPSLETRVFSRAALEK